MSEGETSGRRRRRRGRIGLLGSLAAHALVAVLVWRSVGEGPTPPLVPPPEPVIVTLAEPPPPPPPPDDQAKGGGAPAAAPEPKPEPPKPPPPAPKIPVRPPRRPPPPTVTPVVAAPDPAPEPVPQPTAAQLASARTAGDGPGSGGGAGGGEGGGTGCDMVRRLQAALRRDPDIQAALRSASGSGRPVFVWNGDWIRTGVQDGKGLAGVRQAIVMEVAFAPEACRADPMHGLVLISMADRPGAPRLVLGQGSWRWSDLLGARRR